MVHLAPGHARYEFGTMADNAEQTKALMPQSVSAIDISAAAKQIREGSHCAGAALSRLKGDAARCAEHYRSRRDLFEQFSLKPIDRPAGDQALTAQLYELKIATGDQIISKGAPDIAEFGPGLGDRKEGLVHAVASKECRGTPAGNKVIIHILTACYGQEL